MKIGIDARFYGEAGPGRYIKNVISFLEQIDNKNDYVIFLRKHNFDSYNPKNEKFKKVLADYEWYSFKEQIFFPIILIKQKLNLFYVPHFNIPILYPGKLVTAIADIIMHSFSTEEGTTLPKPYYKFKKIVYYLVVMLALIKSKKVIVPSYATKNDILEHYKFLKPEKIVIAYEGVDPELSKDVSLSKEEVLNKHKINFPYLLYVSSMYKHKNVERLVEAFVILKEKYSFKGGLVIVGKNDTFAQKIQQLIKQKKMENYILMPGMNGYVNDDEVIVLRKNALLYVFPSLKEGFSLTPLEAMSVGLPALVSNIECHREILADAAMYFNPLIPSEMADEIYKILKNENSRKTLIQKGYERVKRYDFKNTAIETLSVFNSVLKNL